MDRVSRRRSRLCQPDAGPAVVQLAHARNAEFPVIECACAAFAVPAGLRGRKLGVEPFCIAGWGFIVMRNRSGLLATLGAMVFLASAGCDVMFCPSRPDAASVAFRSTVAVTFIVAVSTPVKVPSTQFEIQTRRPIGSIAIPVGSDPTATSRPFFGSPVRSSMRTTFWSFREMTYADLPFG